MLAMDILLFNSMLNIQKKYRNFYLRQLPQKCLFCKSSKIFRTFFYLRKNLDKEMLYECIICKKKFYIIIKK
jgi:hypothetical protein